MFRNTLLPLSAAALLATTATAQLCSDNTYKLNLTDAAGVPAPTFVDPLTNETYYQFDTEAVYLAFDPTLPSGTYYVHVTDPIDGLDMVLSTNDPMDRFVTVQNDNGVITLSLPFSANTPVTGLGIGGVGQSLLLQPFTSSPTEPCRFKAWFGDNWDLSYGPTNPWLLAGGIHPVTNQCSVRSYEGFRIGSGNGTDVTGCVFEDLNQNGTRDVGEPGMPNQQVRLVDATTSLTATTDATGCYGFIDVACGEYTVELTVPGGYLATTPTSHAIQVCGCADIEVADFGLATACLPCDGHTIGFWRNCHGQQLVQQYSILAMLPALGIVDDCGNRVAPSTLRQYATWLRNARAYNMAYMLSAQLVAMHNNVVVGFVDPNCVVDDPTLGQIAIGDLLQRATASLWANPFTPSGSPERDAQANLKNALDRANNNLTWMNCCAPNNESCTESNESCPESSESCTESSERQRNQRRNPYKTRRHGC
ncbi:MAG: hypothetical protein KDC98_22400 [Planctomycetes bacterium]|nr:hypothetical protein [Planctomycetota bacterium]